MTEFTEKEMLRAAMWGYSLGKDVETLTDMDEKTVERKFQRWLQINFDQ